MPAGRMMPRRAMVLAAGLGLRMRPITNDRPKPLIEIAGRTMLDRALDRLEAFGIERSIVNSHYLADQIEAHLAARALPATEISHEKKLLDTGGGIVNALGRLGTDPIFAVNADIIWLDGRTPALDRLAAAWSDADMDALLLVHGTAKAFGYRGRGDYTVDEVGRMKRREERDVAPYVFTGIQILHPRLLADAPSGPFSLNVLYDRAERAGRLRAIIHDGEWFHIGTPAALAESEAELSGRTRTTDLRTRR
jgi:MurNAc alpha-1-phosphate uridylyltransferase